MPYTEVARMRAPGARRLASLHRKVEKRGSPYNRRYYSNEKINQLRNTCPAISASEIFAIAKPILSRSPDPKLVRFYGCRPHRLTRDDITLLCRAAKDDGVPPSRSERWIQIKWRLSNTKFWDLEAEVIRPEDPEDWDPRLKWTPDLLPSHLVAPLNTVAAYLREAFDDAIGNLREVFPLMFESLIARKSMINWAWMMQRTLYMLCPGCQELHAKTRAGEFVCHDDPSCWAKRFSWALKPLATKDNVASHVCWWYFLILYLARDHQYDAPILSNFKWEISRADTLLNIAKLPEKYREICHRIETQLSPTPGIPDLIPFPLRPSERSSRLRSHPASREAESRSLKRQRQ